MRDGWIVLLLNGCIVVLLNGCTVKLLDYCIVTLFYDSSKPTFLMKI